MKINPNPQVDRFQKDGFLGPVRAFDPQHLATLTGDLDDLLDGSAPAAGTHHRHLDRRAVYDLCTPPAIVDLVAALLGPDVLLWSSNFFCKQPGSRATPWHQDQNPGIPAVLEPPLNLSAWLAIDDVQSDNGCLKFVPGSHFTTVPHAAPKPDDYFGLADTTAFDLDTAIDMPLEPGQFVLFTDRTLHAADANHSNKRRAGIAIRFTTPFVKILRPINPILIGGEDRFGFNVLKEPPGA